ncbi:hypothetical protein NRR50_001014, partial [Klebsiella pneumoniae]|nr:hypothetical protein [Klebsiella pneumoniae]
MSTYKTGNPLGSAAVKDLFDNAENLDFALNSLTALIWTDRLGKVRPSFFGMETSFLSQMASQESRFTSQLADQDTRFDTFIASSGYDIVGDYTVGTIPEGNPLTITEYNQLIRYNNELYKLTAATNIPFTASGKTDETWTTTDSAHLVSVGDAALRQNLGSNELPGLTIVALPKSGNLSNAIPEFYVDAFGADPTGRKSSTSAILRALAAINDQQDSTFNGDIRNYARLVFGNGIYVAKELIIKSNVEVVGQGIGNTIIIPESGADFIWNTYGTEPYSSAGGAKRLFRSTFMNMMLGCGYQNVFDDLIIPANAGGMRFAHASYINLVNIECRHLDGKGIVRESLWDSTSSNLRLMYCGNTRDQNDIQYALDVGPGNDPYDGSNANRDYGLHVEGCPAMLHFGLRSRHNFLNGGKLEYIRNNDVNTYASSLFEGVDSLQFNNMELSWSNVGHRMFKGVGTTPMNDTSADDTSDYNNDHSRGIEFNNCSIIDSQNLSGDYFEYSSKRGRLIINGGYARHARYLLNGSDMILRDMQLTQCGPELGNIGDNVLVEGLTAENHRVKSAPFNVFSVSGKNNIIRNCEFSTPYGSNSNGCAWIAQSSTADLRVENVTFGGKMQWGIKGAPSAFQYKKFKNLVLADGADYGEIVQGGFSVDGLPTRLINNSGGAVTLMQEVAANTTAVFRGCIHGSASLTIRVENSAGAYVGAATALTDFSISTPQITGNLSNNFSAGGSGTPGDGRFYISSSGNDLSFTNRTTGTVKVYL